MCFMSTLKYFFPLSTEKERQRSTSERMVNKAIQASRDGSLTGGRRALTIKRNHSQTHLETVKKKKDFKVG